MRSYLGLAALLLALNAFTVGCQGKNQAAVAPESMFKDIVKEDVKLGSGDKAEDGDMVLVTYAGKLAKTGVQFDTNDPIKSEKNKNPLAFVLKDKAGVIVGMVDGVKGMQAGGERNIKIPYSKGYGAPGNPPGVPPYADMIFNVKLLYVIKKGHEDEIESEDIVQGSGAEVKVGDKVTINYIGRLSNNRMFDDRSAPERAVTFRVGRQEALSGIDTGIVGMKVGGTRKLTLPPSAGWGAYGKDVVAGNQVLIYEIKLKSVAPGGA